MPEKPFKIIWDLLLGLVYIVGIFISSSLIAFHMMTYTHVWQIEYTFDWLIFFDMFLNFFTAYESPSVDTSHTDEEDRYVKRFVDIVKHYLATFFVFDFIAIVPVLVCEIVWLSCFKIEASELQGFLWFRLLYLTKLIRFSQTGRIRQQFAFLWKLLNHRYMHLSIGLTNTKTFFTTILTMCLSLHFFASVWIFLGLMDSGWYVKKTYVNAKSDLASSIIDSTFLNATDAVYQINNSTAEELYQKNKSEEVRRKQKEIMRAFSQKLKEKVGRKTQQNKATKSTEVQNTKQEIHNEQSETADEETPVEKAPTTNAPTAPADNNDWVNASETNAPNRMLKMGDVTMDKDNLIYPTLPMYDSIVLYINAHYFATTTMTTVGYGEFHASGTQLEMIYQMLMIFSSMALFALVRKRVLGIKRDQSLRQMLEEKVIEMEQYLAAIDERVPFKSIESQIYDKCLNVMKESFKFSVYGVFHKYSFFKQMPSRLKNQLWKVCLGEETHNLTFFFQDRASDKAADTGFMRKVVCALNCTFYDTGQHIVEKGKAVDGVYFIFNGHCFLRSIYRIENREFGFELCLPKCSWFGDYQTLFNVNSTFNLVAGSVPKSSSTPLVKIMNIDAPLFRRYVDEYPEFKRFLILRACIRSAFINYKMKMCSFDSFLRDKLEEFTKEHPQEAEALEFDNMMMQRTRDGDSNLSIAKSIIVKYRDEIGRVGNQKDLNVMSLENRTYLLSKGYLDIGQEVINSENKLNLVKKLNAEMLGVYALENINFQSALEVLRLSLQQWKVFTRDLDDWLGNCINEQNSFRSDISSRTMSTQALALMKRKMRGVLERREVRVLSLTMKKQLEKSAQLENLERLGDFDQNLTDEGIGGFVGTLMTMQHEKEQFDPKQIGAIKKAFAANFKEAARKKTATPTRPRTAEEEDAHLVQLIEQVYDANGFYLHEGSETPGGESQLNQSDELDQI